MQRLASADRRLRPGDAPARRPRPRRVPERDRRDAGCSGCWPRTSSRCPTYGRTARSRPGPARLAMRRTVGSLFPQTDRLDDRLAPGWAGPRSSDERSRALLAAEGLPVIDPGADDAWLRAAALTGRCCARTASCSPAAAPSDVRRAARAPGGGMRTLRARERGGGMIGVLGATGRIGRHVAAGLAERGVEARALVRRPDRGPAAARGARRPELAGRRCAAAFDGVERLLLLTAARARPGPARGRGDRRRRRRRRAADREDLRRRAHARPERHHADRRRPLAQRAAHRALGAATSTFLRPSFFMQNLLAPSRPTVAASGVARGAVRARADRDGRRARRRRLRDRRAARRAADADGAWQLTGPRPVTFDAIARASSGAPLRQRAGEARRAHHAPARRHRRRDRPCHRAWPRYFASGADGTATDHVLRLTGRAALDRGVPRRARAAFAPTHRLARALSSTRKAA